MAIHNSVKTIFKLIAAALLCQGAALACTQEEQQRALGWAQHYAGAFGLDPLLVTAIIWTESRGCQNRVNAESGAIGLGQLMPGTAAELGVDPYDPLENIWGTCTYLLERYQEFGDWELAVAAYFAGPGNVRRYGGVPPTPKTQAYVREVFGLYDDLVASGYGR